MKTKIKIAVITIMGISIGIKAQNIFPEKSSTSYAKILLGNQSSDGLSVFGSMGAGNPVNGNQDYGAYMGFNAFRNSDGNWKHLRVGTVGASRYTVGGDIASGLRGFNWEHTNNSGTGNITWNNIMSLDTSGNLDVGGFIKANKYLYIDGVDNTNTISSTDQLKVSGYGIMGNRGSLYFTNGASTGRIKFGIGRVHGQGVVLELDKDKATFGGNIDAKKHLYINGIDNTNTIASNDQLKVSGYGIMGNRGSLYFTNGASTGNIVFGIGTPHGQGVVLELNKNKATFNGKVAIGTTSTGNHKLAVEGSIGAREIKVEAFPNWSDFVFEKNYNLLSLEAVENHIKEKGHLKDIPSAEDVKKDGFFLGEMDAKLLQKIEELTLYTIEQDKELKKQKKEMEELKMLVKELLKTKIK